MPELPTDCRRSLGLLFITVSLNAAMASAAPPEHAIVPGYEHVFASSDADAVVAGRVLLTELNCVACHVPDEKLATSLAAKRGPVLSQVGMRVRPKWLVDYLSAPHRVKSGTSMPDMLAADGAADRQKNALALAHFLASTGSPADSLGDTAAVKRGEQLFHQIGCVTCHDPTRGNSESLPGSVPLGVLEQKYTITSLMSFLKNPLAIRTGGRMPSFNLNDQQARDLACFFLRDVKIPTNLQYAYYEGNWDKLPDFTKLTAKTTGKSSGFDVGVRERGDQFGLVFTGFIQIPKDGNYRFYLGSDDGSRLSIDGTELISVDGIHPHTVKDGRRDLKQGPHAIRVEYFEGGGEESLTLEIEGAGLPRQPLASIATPEKTPPVKEDGEEAFILDATLVESGRRLFTTRGCAACHEMKSGNEVVSSELKARPLAKLRNTSDGCLAESAVPGVPRYQLNARQRNHLATAIQALQQPNAPGELSPQARIHESFVRFNCYGCHQRSTGPTTVSEIPKSVLADLEPEDILELLKRNKFGGPSETRNPFFLSTMKEMGDEGRLPPPLKGVGDKLTETYLKGILDNGANDRPYMLTSMPKFGGNNVGHLLADLRATDLKTEAALAEFALPVTKMKAIGRRLSGEKGLGCIKCHTFGKHKATGIQSMDLQKMTRRLREDWFHRYMANPQDYRAGTRMPAPWPFGKATIRDVLDGHVSHQMQSVWLFLSDGDKAGVPAGLTKGAILLAPRDEPIIYRNFIEGVSPRGIAVGYPEELNLCFDAEQGCLALIWENGFIDAARHWNGRGQGFQRPHGDNVMSLVRGPAFATLENEQSAWPQEAARKLGYRFGGYRFNSKKQPVFVYSVNDVRITDELVPQKNDRGLAEFSRVISLSAQGHSAPLSYRAAVGSTIEQVDGWFVIDDHLQVQVSSDKGAAEIRKSGNLTELLLRIDISGEPVEITQRYAW